MAECFDDAAIRHFWDGELLSERWSLDNADQLFGFGLASHGGEIGLPE